MALSMRVAPFATAILSTATVLLVAGRVPPYAYDHPDVYGPYPYLHDPYPYRVPPRLRGGVVVNDTRANATMEISGHDFVIGAPTPREKLLLHTTVYKKPGLWSSYASKEISFPPRGSHLRVNITRIHAKDRSKNGTGAFVRLQSGGIGRGNVTLLFKSQKNRSIDFVLDIFGNPA